MISAISVMTGLYTVKLGERRCDSVCDGECRGTVGVMSEFECRTRSRIGVESEYEICRIRIKCENRSVSVGRGCTNLSAIQRKQPQEE